MICYEKQPGRRGKQSDYFGAMIALRGSSETKNRMKHIVSSIVLYVEAKPVIPNLFIMKELVQAQKRTSSVKNVPSLWMTFSDSSAVAATKYYFEKSK